MTNFKQTMPLVPMVMKRSHEGERSMDLYSRLLDERIIMLTEEFTDDLASVIIGQLLYLQNEDPKKDITMYINSPGGSVTAMWAIIDTMDMIKPQISTVCVGLAASAASFVLANGQKGKRFILPNAEVMIHQPLGGAQGQASDVEIKARKLIEAKERGIDFYVKKTGQKRAKIAKDIDRDYYLSAEESVNYGIVDKILKTTKNS